MEPDPEPCSSPHLVTASDLSLATLLLSGGKVIVFPTETFYGLMAGVGFPSALEKIIALKGRGRRSPMPCIIGDPADLEGLAARVTPAQRLLMDSFWPGPLTLVFDAAEGVPEAVTGGSGSVGVRQPGHGGARRLAKRVGPLVATSANLSGEPPVRDVSHLADRFGDVTLFDAGPLPPSLGSTVLDVRTDPPKVMRHGDVPVSDLERALRTIIRKGA